MSKSLLGKIWYFIWEDDSLLSWIVNIILAFILVKFVLYPGMGFVMGTSHPIVAVVSESMEHHPYDFDNWWTMNSNFYTDNSITKSYFESSKFHKGFSKGDIIFLKKPDGIRTGDIIVFQGSTANPIIHRVVKIYEEDGKTYYQTKGDNNPQSYEALQETKIPKEKIIGKAIFKLPYLGWVKLIFVELFQLF